MSDDPLYDAASAYVEAPPSRSVVSADPVNQPMIRHWCEALGDTNPIYVDAEAAKAAGHPGVVAPPTALQIWTMPGINRRDDPNDPATAARTLFIEAGYSSVVATNCEQVYHRYLTLGDEVVATVRLHDVSARKRTALGEGYFMTSVTVFRDGDGELVGEQLFRTLWFKPAGFKPAARS